MSCHETSIHDTAMYCLKLANEFHASAGFFALIKKTFILVSGTLKIQQGLYNGREKHSFLHEMFVQ